MYKKIYRLGAIALASVISASSLLAQGNSASYRITLEAEVTPLPFQLLIGAQEADRSAVWVDLNSNGKRDADEGWSDSKIDPETELCEFTGVKTESPVVIHGPVNILLCGNNGIFRLDVTQNPGLVMLIAHNNSIAQIDLSSNTRLQRLHLSNNQLPRLNVSGLTNVVDLRIGGNSKLSSLDLNGLDRLESLDISGTKISTISNANFSNLKGLNVSDVPDFDFAQLRTATNLEELLASGCSLPTIDLSIFPRLSALWAPNSQFTELDTSKAPNLQQLMLKYCKLTSVDFSQNPQLRRVYLENNSLTSVKLPENNSELVQLDLVGNKPLKVLDVSKQTKLRSLQVDASGIETLDLQRNSKLEELTVSETSLTALNLAPVPLLKILDVSSCTEMTSIDVSKLSQLETFYCNKSGLKSVDLTGNTALKAFRGTNNGFTQLTFNSKNLTEVFCYSNDIKGNAMNELIKSLPNVGRGRIVIIDLGQVGMDNVCTTEHVKAAKAKGWQVLNRNTGGSESIPYDGSKTSALDALEASNIKVYPTQASTKLHIDGAAGHEYFIYGLGGGLVAQGRVYAEHETIELDGVPSGSYLVRISEQERAFWINVVR